MESIEAYTKECDICNKPADRVIKIYSAVNNSDLMMCDSCYHIGLTVLKERGELRHKFTFDKRERVFKMRKEVNKINDRYRKTLERGE